MLVGRSDAAMPGGVREITDNRLDAAVARRTAELIGDRVLSDDEAAAVRFAALDQVRNVDGGFWC